MSSELLSLLGPELITKSGKKETKAVITGKKAVAIYFSAHWCPPCRGFTPVLSEFYELVKEEDADALEIIFASSDSDEPSFNGYYGDMPWTAIPFSSDVKDALGQKFGVRGIPALIVLSPDGKTKDTDGRTTVMQARGVAKSALSKWI